MRQDFAKGGKHRTDCTRLTFTFHFSRIGRSLVEQYPSTNQTVANLLQVSRARNPQKFSSSQNTNEGKSNSLSAYTDTWVPVALLLESNQTLHRPSWDVHFSGFPRWGTDLNQTANSPPERMFGCKQRCPKGAK